MFIDRDQQQKFSDKNHKQYGLRHNHGSKVNKLKP